MAAITTSFLLLIIIGLVASQTFTVSWSTTQQIIDGFGASSAWTAPDLSNSLADLFFSQTNGIGLSFVRSRIAPDGSTEINTMKQAVARGARAWSTPWTPPANWKSNNNINNGGYLLPQYYQNYANYLVDYVRNVSNQGVNLYAISVQNEPDMTVSYESCTYTSQQFHDFIQVLGPTFQKNSIPAKILFPEQSTWAFNLDAATVADTNTLNYVGILATHLYGGTPAPINQYGKPLWETEVSDFNTFDPTITSGLSYAQQIWQVLNAGASAYHYWWLISGNSDNEGLLGQNNQTTKRLYTLGQYSKFVRPGYVKLSVNPTSNNNIYVTAFKNGNSFAVVVVNRNGNNANVSVNLSGSSISGTVQVWVTSSNYNLQQQTSVQANGGMITFSSLANSVTTLYYA